MPASKDVSSKAMGKGSTSYSIIKGQRARTRQSILLRDNSAEVLLLKQPRFVGMTDTYTSIGFGLMPDGKIAYPVTW